MRPVGAFLFGDDGRPLRTAGHADGRYHRLLGVRTGFGLRAFVEVFLITRALFGIAMGGEWGVGAALAFETLPAEGRGFFSGLLQEGYAVGYLMAALIYGTVFRLVGWRGMFVIGALPAFLVIYIRTKVDESPAWLQGQVSQENRRAGWGKDILTYVGTFLFLVVLMFSFNSFSHGTQDLYPTFLQKDHHFTPQTVGIDRDHRQHWSAAGRNFFGTWSEKIGRRRQL
jgi:MFS transporter, SHS family, lactate transporter